MILYTALKAFRELLIRKAIITLYYLFPYITRQFFLNVIFVKATIVKVFTYMEKLLIKKSLFRSNGWVYWIFNERFKTRVSTEGEKRGNKRKRWRKKNAKILSRFQNSNISVIWGGGGKKMPREGGNKNFGAQCGYNLRTAREYYFTTPQHLFCPTPSLISQF